MDKLKLSKIETRALIILFIGCLVGTMGVIPYSLALIKIEVDTTIVVVSNLVSAFIMYPILLFISFHIKRHIDVAGLPVFEKRYSGNLINLFKMPILLGALSASAIILLDIFYNLVLTNQPLSSNESPFLGIFASFYGAICEEVQLRFFLMSLWALILKKLGKISIPMALFISAVMFGVGHLPAMAASLGLESIEQLSGLQVARVMILNFIPGAVFGWLYWKKGLESAIVSHFSADIVLHVLFPTIMMSI
jgi:hypothetical protein